MRVWGAKPKTGQAGPLTALLFPSLTWLRLRWPLVWRLVPSPLLPLVALAVWAIALPTDPSDIEVIWWPLLVDPALNESILWQFASPDTLAARLTFDSALRYGAVGLALYLLWVRRLVAFPMGNVGALPFAGTLLAYWLIIASALFGCGLAADRSLQQLDRVLPATDQVRAGLAILRGLCTTEPSAQSEGDLLDAGRRWLSPEPRSLGLATIDLYRPEGKPFLQARDGKGQDLKREGSAVEVRAPEIQPLLGLCQHPQAEDFPRIRSLTIRILVPDGDPVGGLERTLRLVGSLSARLAVHDYGRDRGGVLADHAPGPWAHLGLCALGAALLLWLTEHLSKGQPLGWSGLIPWSRTLWVNLGAGRCARSAPQAWALGLCRVGLDLMLILPIPWLVSWGLFLAHFEPMFTDAEGVTHGRLQAAALVVGPFLLMLPGWVWYLSRWPAETPSQHGLVGSWLHNLALSLQAALYLVAGLIYSLFFAAEAWTYLQGDPVMGVVTRLTASSLPREQLLAIVLLACLVGFWFALPRGIYQMGGWSMVLAMSAGLIATLTLSLASLTAFAVWTFFASLAGSAEWSLGLVAQGTYPVGFMAAPAVIAILSTYRASLRLPRWVWGAYLGVLVGSSLSLMVSLLAAILVLGERIPGGSSVALAGWAVLSLASGSFAAALGLRRIQRGLMVPKRR